MFVSHVCLSCFKGVDVLWACVCVAYEGFVHRYIAQNKLNYYYYIMKFDTYMGCLNHLWKFFITVFNDTMK